MHPSAKAIRPLWVIAAGISCGLLGLLSGSPAQAIRPFVTDDARVVGNRTAQLETWIQRDRVALQHWVLPAFGPTDWLELSLGAVHGLVDAAADQEHSLGGPLIQAKVLLKAATENGTPGIAVAAGTLFGGGYGGLRPRRSAPFAYVAATESLFGQERLLIHANLGVGRSDRSESWSPAFTAGLGAQIRLVAGLHGVGELVWNDAYAGEVGGAWQAGARYIFGERVQIDTTVGDGLGDSTRPTWFTVGLRMVTSRLW